MELIEPTYEKTEAQGIQLSMIALKAMESPTEIIDKGAISLVVRTLPIKLENTLFKLGSALGIMKRGKLGWMKIRLNLQCLNLVL